MWTGLAIALGLIIGTGVIFLMFRGRSPSQALGRKRQIKHRQQRREQAWKESSGGEGSGKEDSGGSKRPGNDAISEWAGSE
jgi:hypothetical protein